MTKPIVGANLPLLASRKTITDSDVPDCGWFRSGIFLTPEQMAVVDEAKRHEKIHYLDSETGVGFSITKSYLWHVRVFAEAAGLPTALMTHDISEDGEILISRWRLPADQGVVLDQ